MCMMNIVLELYSFVQTRFIMGEVYYGEDQITCRGTCERVNCVEKGLSLNFVTFTYCTVQGYVRAG